VVGDAQQRRRRQHDCSPGRPGALLWRAQPGPVDVVQPARRFGRSNPGQPRDTVDRPWRKPGRLCRKPAAEGLAAEGRFDRSDVWSPTPRRAGAPRCPFRGRRHV